MTTDDLKKDVLRRLLTKNEINPNFTSKEMEIIPDSKQLMTRRYGRKITMGFP